MDKTYDPQSIEAHWYPIWEQRGYFRAQNDAPGKPYCIMLPPPNVTGRLHMGHAFQHTLMDSLIRYHRMQGQPTLWQPGTDHAGIATQMLVERKIEAEQGLNRRDLGRETFIDKIWQWKEQSGGFITQQMRRLGASVDWDRERFTMDDGLSKAVGEVFVKLYEKGLIYRGKRLVNWDPVLRTAISDLEVVSEEEKGHFWHFKYPYVDGSGYVSIATTRPETLLGDTAVAVHPDDERYRDLVGKTIELPLVGRQIPIIADEYVDPDFGSGCVKITPAHDFNDYEVGQRHDLEKINILNPDGSLNDTVPEKYRGLDRFAAREQVVEDMQAQGLLEGVEDHTLMVPRGDRSGSVVEPYLTDQWFVRAEPLAKPAIEAVESGRIEFVPSNWDKTYFEWMRNIQDWCISRQLWWGHRIPAWYDESGQVYVGRSQEEVREQQNLGPEVHLRQDEDVLDTWFSSALWPFSTLGWPDQTPELGRFYPTSVLVTGFDIIFFWVARMIMMGLEFMGDVPFKQIYVHGLVRDYDGAKMSKSKGNVLDPIDLIEGIKLEDLIAKRTANMMQPQKAKAIAKATQKAYPDGIAAYGTDALRFTFAALASPGRDIRFDMGRVEGYRNFCNKLWNASRFVFMQTEDAEIKPDSSQLTLADRWIVSKLQATIQTVSKQFENYRFDLATKALYDFVWHDFCDWYLELVKPVLYGEHASEQQKANTRYTLVSVLEAILRLVHPVMPFISEEIWQKAAPLALEKPSESISTEAFPQFDAALADRQAETDMAWLQDVIVGLRQIRGEMDITPSQAIPVLVAHASDADWQRLDNYRQAINFLVRLESVEAVEPENAPMAATALVGQMQLLVPMAGLIDKQAELARLDKQLVRLEKELIGVKGRLNNENFVNKAPADVVEKAKVQAKRVQSEYDELASQRDKIASL